MKTKLLSKMKAILVAVGLCVGINVWGQKAGTYYIQNVKTGKWLAPGNSWESQASVLKHADYWVLAGSGSSYSLQSVVLNGTKKYLTNGGYCDGSATAENFTFSLISGETDIYSIATSAGKHMTTDGSVVTFSASDATSTSSQWKLVSESDMATALAGATATSPVDATYLIKDHNLARLNKDYSSWINTGASEPKTSSDNTAGVRYSIEASQTAFDVHQSLSSIPNGLYAVQVNGFYHQTGSNENLPYVFAGVSQITIPEGNADSQQAAAESFVAGNYLSQPAFVKVTDGTLNVGVATTGTSCWTVFKNFHLTYFGNTELASATNPISMTYLIANPDFEIDGEGTGNTYKRAATGWSNNNTDDNYRPLDITSVDYNTSGAFTGSYAFEIYKGGGLSGKKIYQTVTGLPNGVYKLQLAARINGTPTGEFIYASSNGKTFTKALDDPDSQSKDYEVYAVVTDGTLEIGLDMNTSALTWAVIDNARLSYYGETTEFYAHENTIPVTSLPVSYPMNTVGAVNPFNGGTITDGANMTALKITKEEVKTWIDSDLSTAGYQPLIPEDNERVNISFTAYHGWESTENTTTTIKVYNSKDEELIAYTYTLKDCSVTDVSFGGSKAAGFTVFNGQSTYNGSNGANGINVGSNSFKSNSSYNLNIKMSLAKDGRVWFYAAGGRTSVDKEYSALLDKDIDLAYIVINDASSDGNRSFCMTDLSVNTETPSIPSLPTATYTFDSDTSPFEGGIVVTGTKVGNILRVNDETAIATIGDKSGEGWIYVPGSRETVTIEFDAYNGYLGNTKTSTFSVLNSDRKVLVGYTYDTKSGNITDVKLGDATVDGFAAFNGRSRYGTNGSGDPINANRYDGTNDSSDKPYQTTTGYNPHVTMTISGSGKVTFRFVCSGYSIDQSYEKTLDDITIDLASLKIVDSNYSSNYDRATCYDNLSITTFTTPAATPVITPADKAYFAETQSVSISCETAGATIHYTTDGTAPTASSTTYSAPFEISATTTVKAIAVCDTYADSEIASATINKLYTQTNVTGKETWDWTVENNGISAYTTESTPKNTDEIVLKNVEFYNNFSIPVGFGDAQKLKVIAQYPFRKSSIEYYFQGSTIKFTTEVPGTIDVDFSNTGSSNGDRYLQLNGENTAFKSGNTTKVNATNIPVAAGEVTLTASTGYFHFFKIVFTPTLNTKGYSTFSSNKNVQVSGANAYTAKLDFANSTITCTKIADGKIPAGNGVLIFGDGTEAVTYNTIDSAPALSDNDLKATTLADGSLASKGENTYYVLSGDTFMEYTGTAFSAGKAYFEVDGGVVQSRNFTLIFDEETTGVNAALMNNGGNNNNGEVYNLNGQRVSQPSKGLYIVDGKKVIK